MDDGTTDYIYIQDVYYLVGILHYNFNIICTVENHLGHPIVYRT